MRLLGFILLGYLPILGGLAAGPGAWYDDLAKAPFHPPGWVFGPAWALLYLLIGLSLWRLDRSEGGFDHRRWGLVAVHHLLNAAWTPLFFALHSPALALADIVLLLVAIVALWIPMLRKDRGAAVLFVPYLLWVLFATALNAWIVALN